LFAQGLCAGVRRSGLFANIGQLRFGALQALL
jgi:hypothetical protein